MDDFLPDVELTVNWIRLSYYFRVVLKRSSLLLLDLQTSRYFVNRFFAAVDQVSTRYRSEWKKFGDLNLLLPYLTELYCKEKNLQLVFCTLKYVCCEILDHVLILIKAKNFTYYKITLIKRNWKKYEYNSMYN